MAAETRRSRLSERGQAKGPRPATGPPGLTRSSTARWAAGLIAYFGIPNAPPMTVPRSAPACVSPNFLGAIVQEQLPGTLAIAASPHRRPWHRRHRRLRPLYPPPHDLGWQQGEP